MSSDSFELDDFLEFAQFPTMIYAKFNEKGVLVDINKQITDLLGWTPEEVIGKHYRHFLATDDETFSLEQSFHQSRIRHKDGRWKWIMWMARKKEDHFLIMGREVTQRLDHESALRLTTERLSLAVKTAAIGIFEWWPEREEFFPDEMAKKLYGYDPGKIFIDPSEFGNAIFRDDLERISKVVFHAFETMTPYSFEYRVRHPDGQVRWLKTRGQPLKEEGKSVRVIGTVVDITDQKEQAEEQRLLSRISEILASSFNYVENIQRVLELLTESICEVAVADTISLEGQVDRLMVARDLETKKISFERKQYQTEKGVARLHPVVERILSGEVVHVKDIDEIRAELKKYYSDKFLDDSAVPDAKSCLTAILKRQDHVMGNITLYHTKKSNRTFRERDLYLAREIAYRMSMALENSLLYMGSQEAVKARDEFLSVASHELKTPLQSLTLQNEMLDRQLERSQEQELNILALKKTLESDRRQLKRITRLIEDMLDITRIQGAKMSIDKEQINFSEVLSDVVDRMRPAFEAVGMSLSLVCESSIIVMADSFRIEQVITNILTNALKYGNFRPVNVEAKKIGKEVKFSVTDKGHGIRKEDQARIFQRFERAGPRTEVSGLGLGLYISQKIVEAHGGKISVASEPEKGSTFTIELPLGV